MPDDVDLSQDTIAAFNAEALDRIINRVPGAGPDWINGVACCRDCGEPIPDERLKALPDAERCAECQEDFEEETL